MGPWWVKSPRVATHSLAVWAQSSLGPFGMLPALATSGTERAGNAGGTVKWEQFRLIGEHGY